MALVCPSLCRSFEALVPGGSSTTGGTVLITVVSVAVIVTLVILMTVVLVLLFKYKCYKVQEGVGDGHVRVM